MMRSRLTHSQIAIMRSLFTRSGFGIPVALAKHFGNAVVTLWRRELVQIWHRVSPGIGAEGPFYSLTSSGLQLASSLFKPRASAVLRGLEQVT